MSVMTDSYKAGHFLMYPEAKSMTAYGEFREPMLGMKTGGQQDNRFVVRARSLSSLYVYKNDVGPLDGWVANVDNGFG
jgi:hypothetical protein